MSINKKIDQYLAEGMNSKWEEVRKYLANVVEWGEDVVDKIDPDGNSPDWKKGYKILGSMDKGFDKALMELMQLEKLSNKFK